MNANYEPMNHQSDSEAAPPDVFPDFAVSLDEAGRRVRMLLEFVRDHMVEGEDYGTIPGTSGKPTLFKPGAEKMNAIFGLAPIVEITNRNEDWDKGFVAYEVKVTLLNKRTSNVEAEGVGNCNSRERKYKNQDAANVANTILKMAKKRALIDATLSATRASGLFTQDLEDLDLDSSSGSRSSSNNHASQQSREYSPRPAPSQNAFGGASQAQTSNAPSGSGGGFVAGTPGGAGLDRRATQRDTGDCQQGFRSQRQGRNGEDDRQTDFAAFQKRSVGDHRQTARDAAGAAGAARRRSRIRAQRRRSALKYARHFEQRGGMNRVLAKRLRLFQSQPFRFMARVLANIMKRKALQLLFTYGAIVSS